jgi:protein subunit release factor A
MEHKVKLFSLGPKDFKVETYRGSGKGGQKRNKTDSAVRITHPESGAIGMSEDERSQLQNKKTAFERLINSEKFQKWLKVKKAAALAGYYEIEKMLQAKVAQDMNQKNLKIEERTEEGWRVINE